MQQATSGNSAATYKMMEPHSNLSITDDKSPTAKKETQQARTIAYIIQRYKPWQVPKKKSGAKRVKFIFHVLERQFAKTHPKLL